MSKVLIVGVLAVLLTVGYFKLNVPDEVPTTLSAQETTCVLHADRNTYRAGEIMTFSWESTHAQYAEFSMDATGPTSLNGSAPGGRLAPSGTAQIKAPPPVVLIELPDGTVQSRPADKGTFYLHMAVSERKDAHGRFNTCEIAISVTH
jgi:hypothetical protein